MSRSDATEESNAIDATTRVRDRLRVATYNVRYAGLDPEPLSWADRRDGVASTIRTLDPDAIALQECWMDQVDDLADRLTGYEWVTSPDENGEHTPIAYRADRLVAETTGGFGIAPEGERDVLAWDAALPRTATTARFRDRRSSRCFSLFSVHFDHQGRHARVAGARLVRDRLPEGPAIVAGDLNAEPGSEPHRVLASDLRDSATVATTRIGPEATYAGFGGEAAGESGTPESRRIDFVFVRGFDVTEYRVVAGEDDPSDRPSDHRPVCVDLIPIGAFDTQSQGDPSR